MKKQDNVMGNCNAWHFFKKSDVNLEKLNGEI